MLTSLLHWLSVLLDKADNPHLHHKGRYDCMAVFSLTGFNRTRKYAVNFYVIKRPTQLNPAKLEDNYTEIVPLPMCGECSLDNAVMVCF